jgi:hypothetical protein
MNNVKLFSLGASAVIAISLACSSYKSAGSPPLMNNTTQDPATVQTNSSTAQQKTPCTLTLASAPVIKGLHLGMTTEEVAAIFPGSKTDPEISSLLSNTSPFGIANFVIKPEKFGVKEKFEGINQINLSVLDGRIYKFYISYNSRQWAHVDNFITNFVEGTSFPPAEQWEAYVGLDNQLKTLSCKDFEARVFAGSKGVNLDYIELLDLVADKTLKDRRKKAREQASPTPGNQ